MTFTSDKRNNLRWRSIFNTLKLLFELDKRHTENLIRHLAHVWVRNVCKTVGLPCYGHRYYLGIRFCIYLVSYIYIFIFHIYIFIFIFHIIYISYHLYFISFIFYIIYILYIPYLYFISFIFHICCLISLLALFHINIVFLFSCLALISTTACASIPSNECVCVRCTRRRPA